jgi:hypothetical protein
MLLRPILVKVSVFSNHHVTLIDFDDILLFHKFAYRHRPIIGNLHKIYPAGQSADVNAGGWFGDLACDELLTLKVHYG